MYFEQIMLLWIVGAAIGCFASRQVATLAGSVVHAFGYGLFLLTGVRWSTLVQHPIIGTLIIANDILDQAVKWMCGYRLSEARNAKYEYRPFLRYRRVDKEGEDGREML
jgi:hypothetical protein